MDEGDIYGDSYDPKNKFTDSSISAITESSKRSRQDDNEIIPSRDYANYL